ncbi:anthrone oxygenase family protein [Sphaerisporangium corydalis]|uniref:DUF1772 domain-containing protein n=1 Tax=Sphaerisporangium corydalis TaxID=1441875 RepID=A0ABV9EGE3_9ACTN|nr:anthrone oxygenase family protein [Sphaerisporangium corydalis]
MSLTLVAATIATGLVAGLFYAFSIAVMPGLGRADDHSFVGTMRGINVAILNGWFMLAFLGAPVLIAVSGVLHLRGAGRPAVPWIVAALVCYLVMLAVTFVVNVPMNDALEAAAKAGTDLAAVRGNFEERWVRWNLARTVFSTAALGFLAWALVVGSQTLK